MATATFCQCHSNAAALLWRLVFDPGGSPHAFPHLCTQRTTEGPWRMPPPAIQAQSTDKPFTPAAAVCEPQTSPANSSRLGLPLLPAPIALSPPDSSSTAFDEITFLIDAGRFYQALHALRLVYAQGIVPPQRIYWSYLKACNQMKALFAAKQLHAHLVFYGQEFVSSLGDFLLSTLFSCGGFELAIQVFLMLPRRNVFTWKAIITGYIEYGLEQEAWVLYKMMLEDGVEPDKYTYAILIKSCGHLMDLDQGKAIHADAQENGLHRDPFVVSTLIYMYGKCMSIAEAENVFGNATMLEDVVLWNTMLSLYAEQGEAEKALQLYRQMQEEGPQPNSRTFVACVSACCTLGEKEDTGRMCLAIGEGLHIDAFRMGFGSNAILGNNLVRMYGTCGCMTRAQSVFNDLPEQSVVSWTLMLSNYLEVGQEEAALQMYRRMHQEGISPDEKIIVVALQGCCSLARREEPVYVDGEIIKLTSLAIGKALHHDVKTRNFDSDCFVKSALIGMYAMCGRIKEAENVFDENSQHNLVTFNSMLSAYVEHGEAALALCLYRQMHEEGMQTDERTMVIAMQACSILAENETPLAMRGRLITPVSLDIGRSLHCDAVRRGFGSDAFIGSTLLSMYRQCGSFVDAENLLSGPLAPTSMLWMELLYLYVSEGEGERALHVFKAMQEEGVSPNKWAYTMAIQACCTIAEAGGADSPSGESSLVVALLIGQALHMDASENGFISDVVGSTLITLYSMCGDVVGAEDVFLGLSLPDIISWNAMMSTYREQGDGEKILKLYRNLESESVCQNEGTFVIALQACQMLTESREARFGGSCPLHVPSLEIGRALHADARRKGLHSHPLVFSALLIMYSTCGSMVDVESMFNRQLQHDIVSWTALLSAYVEHDDVEKALQLFRFLQKEGIAPDERTFVLALGACAKLAEKEEAALKDGHSFKETCLKIGHALHADCVSMGFTLDASICSSIVHVYGKCMSLAKAENAFDRLPRHSILPYNAMLSTYVDHGQGDKALSLYRLIQYEDMPINESTIVFVLQACSLTGHLEMCREVHYLIHYAGLDGYRSLPSVLAHAYGSCSSIADCQAMLDSMVEPDVASWNAIISGYARKGEYSKSIQTFEEMQQANVIPNRVTALLLLSSCSHAGDVDGCLHFFQYLSGNLGVVPDMEHVKGMIDVFGRAGDLSKVKDLLSDGLFQPSLPIWLCVLGACQNYGHVDLGNWVFDQAMHLQPTDAKAYIAMSNMYASLGKEESLNEVCMHAII